MKPIHILLVEDNEGDILMTIEAFEDSKIANTITVLRDGKAAIDYIDNMEVDTMPTLVLLDINLPKMSGHEVLRHIKRSEKHKQVPVIMLTTSSSERDILSAYKHYANCYITKPIDISEFMVAIAKIEDFWINIVSTPSN